jgi:hypothetical protein
MLQEFIQSSEFKRSATNATDSGIKLFFKYAAIAVNELVKFIQEMFRSVLGK